MSRYLARELKHAGSAVIPFNRPYRHKHGTSLLAPLPCALAMLIVGGEDFSPALSNGSRTLATAKAVGFIRHSGGSGQ